MCVDAVPALRTKMRDWMDMKDTYGVDGVDRCEFFKEQLMIQAEKEAKIFWSGHDYDKYKGYAPFVAEYPAYDASDPNNDLSIPTNVEPDWSKAMRIHSQRFHYGCDLDGKLLKPITVAQKMTKVIAAYVSKEKKTEATLLKELAEENIAKKKKADDEKDKKLQAKKQKVVGTSADKSQDKVITQLQNQLKNAQKAMLANPDGVAIIQQKLEAIELQNSKLIERDSSLVNRIAFLEANGQEAYAHLKFAVSLLTQEEATRRRGGDPDFAFSELEDMKKHVADNKKTFTPLSLQQAIMSPPAARGGGSGRQSPADSQAAGISSGPQEPDAAGDGTALVWAG